MIFEHLAALPALLLAGSLAMPVDDPDSDGFVPLLDGRDHAGWKVPAGDDRCQVNVRCWPIGSGAMCSTRTVPHHPSGRPAGVTPRHQADRPVGERNGFEIPAKGETGTIGLNETEVIPEVTIPDMPETGRIALRHKGSRDHRGEWIGAPSLVQFRSVPIREPIPEPEPPRPTTRAVRALLITGGHEHEASFYSLFDGYEELDRLPVDTAANAFKQDLRGKYDVVIMYDFTRDLDDTGRKHLRDFVEAGKGIVVLHHALLNYQTWTWWSEEVVGGRYRLQREGGRPSSRVKADQQIDVRPAGAHPVLDGVGEFRLTDETYKDLYMSPKILPLLTTDNPTSDPTLAWIGPCRGSRVVAIQLGHGPTAFKHPTYRRLVYNAVVWAAGKTK